MSVNPAEDEVAARAREMAKSQPRIALKKHRIAALAGLLDLLREDLTEEEVHRLYETIHCPQATTPDPHLLFDDTTPRPEPVLVWVPGPRHWVETRCGRCRILVEPHHCTAIVAGVTLAPTSFLHEAKESCERLIRALTPQS